MRLTDLEPQFLSYGHDEQGREIHRYEDTIEYAQGIMFLCPKCFAEKGANVHHVICWNPSVPNYVNPKPGRWNLVGTGYRDLSLVAGSSSILLTSGCRWHGFIRDGEATI